jgi:sec-independent protein translocase protein TatA
MNTIGFIQNLGGPELIILLVIVLLLFGAKKLPELGSSVGKSIKNFKKGIDEGQTEEGRVDEVADERSKTTSPDPNL